MTQYDALGDHAGSITRRDVLIRGGVLLSMSSLLAACGGSDGGTSGGGGGAAAKGAGDGLPITQLTELKPFEFSNTVGPKPVLPKRMAVGLIDTSESHLLFAKQAERACKERGIDFISANADTNVPDSVKNIQSFLQRECGVIQMQPIAAHTLDPVAKQALSQGVAVFNEINGPSTLQEMADQYQIGQFQGEAAADWVRSNLGGKATVAYFNPDALAPVLAARTKGALTALEAEPGIEVVNIGLTQQQWNAQGGFTATSSLLQAHPDVEVIVSGDTVITGAVKAVRVSGNSKVKYIGGTDGEATILKAITAGDPLIKSTFAFAMGVVGYAAGQFAADWFEGKAIPQAIRIVPFKIDSAEAVERFDATNNDPAKAWRDSSDFLDFHGAVSYGTREKWIQNGLVGGPAEQ